MGLAVGEEVIDDHADDREEEDNESPDDLVGNGAVGLEDFDCGALVSSNPMPVGARKTQIDLLHAMISRTRTMKPTMPPPVPACHGLAL